MVPVASWKRPRDRSGATALAAGTIGFGGHSGGHFSFGQHLLNILLNGVETASEVPVADASHVDAYNGVTTGRGHLTGQRDSVQQNIRRVLAEREVSAAVAAETNKHGGDGCCS